MPDDDLTLTEIRGMAAEIGWTGLTDAQLEDLLRATRAARARRSALPLSRLDPHDEPAHVFRLPSSPSLLPEGEGSHLPPLSSRERGRG